MTLVFEQLLNGVQFGVTLFLLAAGLTLVFGIMGLVNLAHGSFYMVGAFFAASVQGYTGSFWLGGAAGSLVAAACGAAVEAGLLRQLYRRDHLQQVLVTFGLIMFFNELMAVLFGRQPLLANVPAAFTGSVEVVPGVPYSAFRLLVIGMGVLVAAGLYVLVNRTRVGMLVRAGATHRDMVRALGVNVPLLYTAVFALGAMLAGFAGALTARCCPCRSGMGDRILITTFVVIVVGGSAPCGGRSPGRCWWGWWIRSPAPSRRGCCAR